MSTNDISVQEKSVRFVLDRSFLHDSFRSDYPPNKSAKWLFPYLVYRIAYDKSKVCAMSSTVVDIWSREFRTYPGVTPQAVLAVKAIVDIYPLASINVRPDDSTLFVAKILYDSEAIPVILSSVKEDKWKERAQTLGLKFGFEEFSEEMSKKRLDRLIWFSPLSADFCVKILRQVDPLYHSIVRVIGYP